MDQILFVNTVTLEVKHTEILRVSNNVRQTLNIRNPTFIKQRTSDVKHTESYVYQTTYVRR